MTRASVLTNGQHFVSALRLSANASAHLVLRCCVSFCSLQVYLHVTLREDWLLRVCDLGAYGPLADWLVHVLGLGAYTLGNFIATPLKTSSELKGLVVALMAAGRLQAPHRFS
eukprot:scaffold84241_cov15-Tisochrysis_lutea.AAC.2